jgi:hypothetical protein
MTRKKLNVDSIANELEGASLFFTKSAPPLPAPEPEKPVIEKDKTPLTDSPFFEKPSTPPLQAQAEENQDQKRSNERTFEPPNGRPIDRTDEFDELSSIDYVELLNRVGEYRSKKN